MKKLPVLAILCGGRGTRLKPYTDQVAKSVVLVNDRPFIHYLLENVKTKGFNDVVLCVGQFKEQIKEACGDGSQFGLSISYIQDDPDDSKLLGTGGALVNAFSNLGEEFFVTYGDTLIDFSPNQMLGLLSTKNVDAVMAIYKNNDQYDASNVILKNDNFIYYNKNLDEIKMAFGMPEYIDYGISLIKKSSLHKYASDLDKKQFDLSLYLSMLSYKKRLVGIICKDRFYEIGSPLALIETENFLRNLS